MQTEVCIVHSTVPQMNIFTGVSPHFQEVINYVEMKSTKVQNPRRRQSCSILAYSHCKLVTVSRAARTQEGRFGLLESTEPGRWALDGRKQEGL